MATGNRDSTKQRRFRWWLIPLLLVPIAAGALIHWLRKPLPPPVVSLSLMGFKVNQTNTYAVMSLTNLGRTTIHFDSTHWRAEFETPKGMVTNQGFQMSSIASSFVQDDGTVFSIELPRSASRWRVVTGYGWFDRRKPRADSLIWLGKHRGWQNKWYSDSFSKAALAVLGYLPDQYDRFDFVTTPWLTNLPPAAPVEP